MIPLRNKIFYTKNVLKLLDEEVISILNRNVSTIENGINCLKQSVWDKMARLFSYLVIYNNEKLSKSISTLSKLVEIFANTKESF